MPIKPIKRSAISEDVTLRIMSMIRNGELRPGDKLPSERQLAEAFGVSRVSLREGLRTLAFMKVLDVRTGDGTYVSSLDAQELVEPLTFVIELSQRTLFELVQARQLIEPFLAEQAALHASDDEIAQLRGCLALMEVSGEDYPQMVESDKELHRLIAEAAQNAFLYRFITTLSALVMKRRPEFQRDKDWVPRTIKMHRAIVEAIAARDASAAKKAMVAHLAELAAEIDPSYHLLES